jgi:hypothetical protein
MDSRESEEGFVLISDESDAEIELQMQRMFPVGAEKVQNVPYVIQPSKQTRNQECSLS